MRWPIALTVATVACAMEGWATLLHRFAWHEALWPWHRSHHRGWGDIAAVDDHASTGWQCNDLFGLLHALVAIALIVFGCRTRCGALASELALGTGWGMTVFGACYVIVHDGLAHGRLPVKWLRRWRFFRRIAAAHQCHHRTGGPPFGLFSGPWVLRRAAAKRRARRAARRINVKQGAIIWHGVLWPPHQPDVMLGIVYTTVGSPKAGVLGHTFGLRVDVQIGVWLHGRGSDTGGPVVKPQEEARHSFA